MVTRQSTCWNRSGLKDAPISTAAQVAAAFLYLLRSSFDVGWSLRSDRQANVKLRREGLLALHVMFPEVVAVLAGAHVIEPRHIFAIPGDGLRQPRSETNLGPPAQLSLELLAVDGVAQVVSLTVADELNERFGAAEGSENQLGHLEVALLASSPDVVNLAFAAALQHRVRGGAVIADMDPVAHVAAFAIHRQRFARHRLRDHQRDELLGKLV